MDWGRDSHLWEGIIAGVVMVVTWLGGSTLAAGVSPAVLNLAGLVGVLLLVVCGTWLLRRRIMH